MIESQQTITDWANKTFGRSLSNIRVAVRANEEMAELLRALSADDNSQKALEEIADIVIVLSRLATNLGGQIDSAVIRKMEINRARQWNLDGSGHGYHVRTK